ncbi:preprotein translocase subunit YajC [Syntrophomonas wolfei]|jgi:preprotein translocase subunit YajC|nr:preprotein translocase subunit YajC [Syntrophomonas wolfei]
MTIAIYFGLFLAIFYFFLILPRKKQEKKHKIMVEELKKGDRVVTIGGIRGEIGRVKEDTIMLKVADNMEIEMVKKAVAYKVEE